MIDVMPFFKAGKKHSTRLMDLVKEDSELDITSETGFKGIEIVMPDMAYDFPSRIPGKSLDSTAQSLVVALKDSISDSWNPNDSHFIMCSAGRDSRLLVTILKILESDNGKDWLGEIKIICHEESANRENRYDSSYLFLRTMRRLKFAEDQFSVYNQKGIGKPDYFPFIPSFVPNGFYKPDFQFFNEQIDMDDLKRWVVVHGAMGGEALEYPSRLRCTPNGWEDLKPYIMRTKFTLSQYNYHFKGVFMPFLGKSYLDNATSISPELFRFDIRRAMLRVLGDKGDIPAFLGHNYNWAITDTRKVEIMRLYRNSAFYQRFSGNERVNKASPIKDFYGNNLDTKLFGLALTYEEKFGKK